MDIPTFNTCYTYVNKDISVYKIYSYRVLVRILNPGILKVMDCLFLHFFLTRKILGIGPRTFFNGPTNPLWLGLWLRIVFCLAVVFILFIHSIHSCFSCLHKTRYVHCNSIIMSRPEPTFSLYFLLYVYIHTYITFQHLASPNKSCY